MNTKLLDALYGRNEGPPPIWFMRQAGRFLPEYRALREKHTLSHLFHTPALAATVTLQPVHRLGVDAAILFSDILVITEALGYTVDFPSAGGIHLTPPDKPVYKDIPETLPYVAETIRLLKPQLKVPLIGFCGGPYTVARYMKQIDPPTLHLLTQATLSYLRMQIEAGVDVVQIFDSWAGELEKEKFLTYVIPYLRTLVEGVRPFPVILFCRGSCRYAKELASLSPTAISFDWEEELTSVLDKIPSTVAVQGNLDPSIFAGPWEEVEKKSTLILESMRKEKRFIFNLGHGVLPSTPVENGERLVQLVQTFIHK